MARCGCASATCSCVLADGVNTTTSGDGSQATPYTVNVSCEAIQDCVGAAMNAGCGLTYDDAANTMGVELSAQGGNTLQCLPDGLFSTPGAVAIGCGLTTDGGGNIVVNTAGAFGDLTRRNCNDTADSGGTTPLDPACELEGMPVYCDINGDLRTKPEKFTEVAAAAINEAVAVNVLPFTTSSIQIAVTNPSDCYCMCGWLIFSVIPAISGAPGTVIQIAHEIDLGVGLGFSAVSAYVMDNRGKTANAGGGNYRMAVQLNECLDPGETKTFIHRVAFTRFTGDNGGAVSITAIARDIRYVGTNL